MSRTDADAALTGLGIGSVLMLQQEIPQAATERALELAKAQGVVSILNTAPFLDTTQGWAEQASIVIANETEFELLTGAGVDRLDAAMADWASAQNQTVIVTLGPDGARAATPDGSFAGAGAAGRSGRYGGRRRHLLRLPRGGAGRAGWTSKPRCGGPPWRRAWRS